MNSQPDKDAVATVDHTSDERFYDYYAKASQSETTRRRFRSIRDCIFRVLVRDGEALGPLEVADIGCGAGTQTLLWAELGHRVHGLDVNEALVNLAKKRALEAGLDIDYRIGSAVKLPWPEGSMDVCIVPELLEHVAEWENCLSEFARILRPGGILYLTTTNCLCPRQSEFNLPLYSWYPAVLKRYFERLSVSTRPSLANFAKYPAVNWFSFYSLRKVLSGYGFNCLDRFDAMDLSNKAGPVKAAVSLVRRIPVLRVLAHMLTEGTIIVGVRIKEQGRH